MEKGYPAPRGQLRIALEQGTGLSSHPLGPPGLFTRKLASLKAGTCQVAPSELRTVMDTHGRHSANGSENVGV